ncbi:MAG: 23S rRNA (guanosine(2251)-2'-O)-methyltransferase RlmB [Oscillospiraceae bacterium]|jgi:23S rRNA (guanosine2251-2'-O)-methyltransferase|nr:23S rRNA (guanosine(2251)-2'-O)-methyltransferase RlmB [Oscillospiraceae bacterium]
MSNGDRRGFPRAGRASADNTRRINGGAGPRYGEAEETTGAESICGRNTVLEALRAGLTLDKVYISKDEDSPALARIAAMAREAGAVVVRADKRKLEWISGTSAYQGVAASIPATEYASIEDILGAARERGEQPLVIVCDEVSDPHNLGAIIRTAEAAGAHGVIIPKRRSAGLTAVVAKTSAGAVFHLPTARVANITAALKELKAAGLWIYGAAPDGDKTLWETDLTGPAAIVVGSEGRGLGRLVAENCDFSVKIPMTGRISSLNASVSAAVLIYEASRQRGFV